MQPSASGTARCFVIVDMVINKEIGVLGGLFMG